VCGGLDPHLLGAAHCQSKHITDWPNHSPTHHKQIEEVQSTTKTQRVAVHTHVKVIIIDYARGDLNRLPPSINSD
jgi:hypothetical protein